MVAGQRFNNTMKRINFLTVEKLSKYNYDRLGIDLIQSRGYKVEVWDFSPSLRPEYNNLYEPSDGFEFAG